MSYRYDGVSRTKVTLMISVESKYLFDKESNDSMSEFLENKILEEYNTTNKLGERRTELMGELKLINKKMRNFDIKSKQNVQILNIKNKKSCDLCGIESKNLINLKKQKVKICKNCYKNNTSKDITRILKK